MAIQFARIEIVSRSLEGNSCCKAAYNARAIIKDQQTNVVYMISVKNEFRNYPPDDVTPETV